MIRSVFLIFFSGSLILGSSEFAYAQIDFVPGEGGNIEIKERDEGPADAEKALEEMEGVFSSAANQMQDVEESQETLITGEGGGCLIATAAYGSELAPQIQQLRELRDSTLLVSDSGFAFLSGFNSVYYVFSPTIADLERQNPIFKEFVKLSITPMISTLSILNHAEMNSESSILGYGIGVIMLNVGMYFVAPVIFIIKLKKNFSCLKFSKNHSE